MSAKFVGLSLLASRSLAEHSLYEFNDAHGERILLHEVDCVLIDVDLTKASVALVFKWDERSPIDCPPSFPERLFSLKFMSVSQVKLSGTLLDPTIGPHYNGQVRSFVWNGIDLFSLDLTDTSMHIWADLVELARVAPGDVLN